jgi:hypothetical protein|tara:strand:+ start:2033 stop:2185 length:153 start_codon:yes stop_codon:yes gene_type:complete
MVIDSFPFKYESNTACFGARFLISLGFTSVPFLVICMASIKFMAGLPFFK